MSSSKTLMGLDIGYTGCKAVAFNEQGDVLASAYREYPMLHPEPGMVELDPELLWHSASSAIREATSSLSNPVDALSISVMGEAFTPVDRHGRPVCNSLTSFDSRGRVEVEELTERVGRDSTFELTGQTPDYSHPLPKICWLKKNRPEVYRQTHKFLCYGEFVLTRLGLPPIIDYSMAARSMAFDVHQKRWSETMLESAEVDPEMLPEIAPSGTPVGHPSPEIADQLGLSRSTLVVVGGHDQPCGAVGSGVVRNGQATYALGTVHVICAVLDDFKPSLGAAGFPCYPHVVPNRFVTMAYNLTGGCLLRWLRDNFASGEVSRSESAGKDAYDLMLADLPNDPTNLFTLPHFSGTGTPWFDTSVKGSILGLELNTKRSDIIKAAIEGTAYELAMNLRLIERGGACIQEMHAIGGGAKSSVDLQIRSNIMNRSLMAMCTSEAPALGAAILAGVGAGVYDSPEISGKLVGVREVYRPDATTAEQYGKKLDAYEAIYPLMRQLYHKLSELQSI